MEIDVPIVKELVYNEVYISLIHVVMCEGT